MKAILFVMVAGALGALSRYTIINILEFNIVGLDVLVLNVLGCLFAGLIISYCEIKKVNSLLKTVITIGFLGAFTTFSSFINYVVIIGQSSVFNAFMYILLMVVLGFFAVLLGDKIIRRVIL